MDPQEVLKKYATGEVSPEEKLAFREWLQTLSERDYRQLLQDHARIMADMKVERPEDPAWMESIFRGIEAAEPGALVFQGIGAVQSDKIVGKSDASVFAMDFRRRWWRLGVAAAVLLLLGIGAYFLFVPGNVRTKINPVVLPLADIQPPTGTKTILTLADGRQILLDSVRNGVLTQQGGTEVAFRNNKELAYNGSAAPSTEILYNTLSTGRGGQTTVLLADGSKVWLNALSSLRYPSGFTGRQREVELTGEAYFEVAKKPGMPFHVKVGGMQVDVLGTRFDINAYGDETNKKTTLLEGSVQLSSAGVAGAIKLQPGQQAQWKDGQLTVTGDMDLDEVMAWKNGRFQFSGAGITAIMRQAARWYDMEVEYQGAIDDRFSGEIPRNVAVSQLLNILSATNKVKFEIHGNKIIITAK